MARKRPAKTPAQIKVDDLRSVVKAAREKAKKTNALPDQKLASEAADKLAAALTEARHEHFKRITVPRVKKALSHLASLKTATDRSRFSFTAEDKALIFTRLRERLDDVERHYDLALEHRGGSQIDLEEFSFG